MMAFSVQRADDIGFYLILEDGVTIARSKSPSQASRIVKALEIAAPLCGYDLGDEHEGVRRICRRGKNHHGPCSWILDVGQPPTSEIAALFPTNPEDKE